MCVVVMYIQELLFLMEKVDGLDYSILASSLQGKLSNSQEHAKITKDKLKQLLTLARAADVT